MSLMAREGEASIPDELNASGAAGGARTWTIEKRGMAGLSNVGRVGAEGRTSKPGRPKELKLRSR